MQLCTYCFPIYSFWEDHLENVSLQGVLLKIILGGGRFYNISVRVIFLNFLHCNVSVNTKSSGLAVVEFFLYLVIFHLIFGWLEDNVMVNVKQI